VVRQESRRIVIGVSVCPAITPGEYGSEPMFSIEKLGAVCVYLCPNMLDIACCGIPKVATEPSMLVRL
jgi:hypothetical protein